MDMRTGYGYQGRMHSKCIVVAQTMNSLYKQLVEYYCSSLLSSLVNFPLDIVVVTTRQNGTCSLLTSAKLSIGYLVVGIIRELDKELSLYCFSIYINTIWSMLQQYLLALMSMSLPYILLLIYHASTSRLPTMPCPYALTSYSLISITIHIPCIHYEKLISLDIIPNPNSSLDSSQSFQTLSPSRPLQTTLAYIT